MKIETLRNQLDSLNLELERLTDREALELASQTGAAEEDSLFLYGIVGGKDVGKTSLINQLAGARISIDSDVLDEGTNIAVAYCSQADIPALEKRLGADARERLKIVSHEREELKNVVLIDFPDFDSRFLLHREDVKRFGKHLQGMVWVTTPRKYGDHEFIEQLETVAQSSDNYYVILNKFDQVAGKADLPSVREEVLAYLTRDCKKKNVTPPDSSRFLMISALDPEAYEFPQLHSRLVRIHSPEEIAKAKAKNLRAEFDKNLARIRSHFALSDKIEEIGEALESIRETVHEIYGGDYFDTVQKRVEAMEELRRRISRGLFTRRIEGWPILRSLFYPLAGIVSALGNRFAFAKTPDETPEDPRDALRYEGMTAAGWMRNVREKTEMEYPHLKRDMGPAPKFPEVVEQKFIHLIRDYEEQIVNRLSEGAPTPTIVRRILVYAPLIWFPILQPLLVQMIQYEGSLFSIAALGSGFAALISLFGAGQLLQSLVFLLVFYATWLIFLYSQGVRIVIKEGHQEFHNTWFQQFLPWIIEALSTPLQKTRIKLTEKNTQLQEIETNVQKELDRMMGGRGN